MASQKSVILGVALLALSACASSETSTPALVQARQSYTAAANDPAVARNAAQELLRAEDALRKAEAAAAEGASETEVNHKSYVATRASQIAMETAALNTARDTVARADMARGTAVLQARNAELERQLRELEAQQTERGLVMTLGDVLFSTGRADLTAGAEARMDRLATFLQRNPNRTIRVEGYTDSTGSSQTNLRLSEQRAAAVREALVTRGVNPGRIVTQGFGAARPVASNSSDAGRQANRRVEIVISEDGSVAETRVR